MTENTERLNVIYCGNERVFPLILLSALSIVRHTENPITIYLLTMDLSEREAHFLPIPEEKRAILEEVLRKKNTESRAVLLDARNAYLRRLGGGKCDHNSYTPYAQGRLLLSEFDLPERLLYLDTDVMCCSDAAQTLAVDLDSYEFAAVIDVMGTFWIARDYCNSGVMLLNMKNISESGLLERACELLKRKRLAFPDQSALNRLVKHKLILPRKFNEQRAIRPDTVFKHFCQGIRWLPFFKVYNIKQNDVKNVHEKLHITCFDDVYAEYDRLAEEYGLAPLKR